MTENKNHSRVPLTEIRENPDKGIYMTRNELKKYGIFAGLILAMLSILSLFGRKG